MRKGKKYLSLILFLAAMMLPVTVFAETTDGNELADKNAVAVISEDTNEGDDNAVDGQAAGNSMSEENAADGEFTGDDAAGESTSGGNTGTDGSTGDGTAKGDDSDDSTADGDVSGDDSSDDDNADDSDSDEDAETNWQKVESDGRVLWQYVDEESGTPFCSKFVLIGENVYCFDENGYLMTGLIEITDTSEEMNGIYYAVEAGSEEDTPENSSFGAIVFDTWVLFEDEKQIKCWIHFDEDGRAMESKDGWNNIDGKWYWLKNGVPATGWRQIYKKWYYLSAKENGAMQIGWQTIGGKKYYLSSSQNDGSMKYGWQKIDGKWYYLSASNNDGSLKIGWKKIGNKWYYLSNSLNDGAMKAGWQKISGKWYYLGGANDGSMKYGWQTIGGKKYYLSGSANDGSMKYGWQKIGGKWYYFGGADDGAMKTGWQKVGNYWYFMYSSGVMASRTWIGSYYVNSSGRWVEMDYVWPLPGYTYISSDFGYRTAPTAGASTNHNGIDIPAPAGTPIRAVADGRVAEKGSGGPNGNYIKIDHGDGLMTAYLHMSDFAVGYGASVKAGQIIGYVGTTGVSTGNHLHLGFYENRIAVSPWNYLQRM